MQRDAGRLQLPERKFDLSSERDFLVKMAKSDRRASPGFPVELVGVGEVHAAFLNESRTRRCCWRSAAGNPGRPSFSTHVRFGERGAPVRFPPSFATTQTPGRADADSLAVEVRLCNDHFEKRTSGAKALIDAVYYGTAEALPFVESGH
jgi:hypothetical protein